MRGTGTGRQGALAQGGEERDEGVWGARSTGQGFATVRGDARMGKTRGACANNSVE